MNAPAPDPLDVAWFADAACKGKSSLFWSHVGETTLERARREARALKICHACPVMDECRGWARAHREPGVWGGETEVERAAAGYRPAIPGLHLNRDVRRATERGIAAQLALGDLTDDQIEAIHRLIEGDPTCS